MPTNRLWVLKRRAEAEVQLGDVELIERPACGLAERQALGRTGRLSPELEAAR